MPVWASLHRHTRRGLPLWLEIALVLLIKLAALYFLWQAFFSHPQTKHMALPTATVEQHLLQAPQSAPQLSSQSPSPPTSPALPERFE